MRTGFADLPLHGGSAPRWLFERMVKLEGAIAEVIVEEYGTAELLRRLSSPHWFQAFACAVGFDWHSSGTTTVTCGALKEALALKNLGVRVAGGKGATSRATQQEIVKIGDEFSFTGRKIDELRRASRMCAKVDNNCVQDGHELYHHVMVVAESGDWCVIQQGMHKERNYARRYHWFQPEKFVVEPHAGIVGERIENVLDLTAKQSVEVQKTSVDLVCDDFERLPRYLASLTHQSTLEDFVDGHPVKLEKLQMPLNVNWEVLKRVYEFQPRNFEELVEFKGVGVSTLRALALISEIIFGKEPSWKDPVRFSFAVGGKDGVPYPVDRKAMDESTRFLIETIEGAKIGKKEKLEALKRLPEIKE
ncbi:MAG: DUF763 domain-containing protein [Thermoplasmata archaeon]